jgi:hypothetical protein
MSVRLSTWGTYTPGVGEDILRNCLGLDPALILALGEDSSSNRSAACQKQVNHLLNRPELH